MAKLLRAAENAYGRYEIEGHISQPHNHCACLAGNGGDFREDIRSFCSKRGVDYIMVNTEHPIEKVLFEELLKAGIME